MAFPKAIEDAFKMAMDAARNCDLAVAKFQDKDGKEHFVLGVAAGCACHQRSFMPLAILRDDLHEFLVQPTEQVECLGAVPDTSQPSSQQISKMLGAMIQDAMRGKPPLVN